VKDYEVLILAGGKGTRLQSVVSDLPKPMAPIAGRPFLEYQVKFLKNNGFHNFCFLTGFKAKCVEDYFEDGSKWGVEIRYSVEEEPLGTGGAIKLAMVTSTFEKFICLNGDSLFTCDLNEFLNNASSNVTSIALKQMHDFDRYGVVKTNEQGDVLSFEEKKHQLEGWINSGIYCFDRSLNSRIPEGFVSLESEVFPLLSQDQSLKAVKLEGEFIDIGIPEDYNIGQNLIPEWIKL